MHVGGTKSYGKEMCVLKDTETLQNTGRSATDSLMITADSPFSLLEKSAKQEVVISICHHAQRSGAVQARHLQTRGKSI